MLHQIQCATGVHPGNDGRWTVRRTISIVVMTVALAALFLSLLPAITDRSTPAPLIKVAEKPDDGVPKKSPTATADSASKANNPKYPSLKPPGSKLFEKERNAMVDRQIAFPRDIRTAVQDKKVIEVMRAVPRHEFVPPEFRRHAYRDTPLPIGHGQTISQPYMVAYMTELFELKPGAKVLEIGTGSGYQAAVLAHFTDHVYSVEIVKALAGRAARTLKLQKYDNVKTRQADGYSGWKEHAPYDAIIVTCSAGHLPPPLWEQLKPGGRIVVPIGGPYEVQRLVIVTKTPEGKRRSRTLMAVRFVPMTGQMQRPPK